MEVTFSTVSSTRCHLEIAFQSVFKIQDASISIWAINIVIWRMKMQKVLTGNGQIPHRLYAVTFLSVESVAQRPTL